jgi:hypothetical protein
MTLKMHNLQNYTKHKKHSTIHTMIENGTKIKN